MSSSAPAGRVFLEALRLDLEAPSAVRRRAEAALGRDVGGFLLFGGQIETVASLVESLETAAGRPLWIAADLERGGGQQFRGLPTLPPPAALAAHPRPIEAARRAGRRTGRDARAAGVNLVLAPVLDLDLEPRNPIVGTRSFGPDPRRVAELGGVWIDACQAEGVGACAKHFPGHGRTTGDSHAELPRVAASREDLESDLGPFRAVADRVAAMMTAHVAFPSLGGAGPATLEPAVLTGLLRDGLRFDGLILTDAMNMGGFTGAAGEPGEALPSGGADLPLAARALAAGCDLLLYPPDLRRAVDDVRRASSDSPEVAEGLRRAISRSESALTRWSAGRRAPGRGTEETDPVAAMSEAAELAMESIGPVGGPVPPWLSMGREVGVTAVWDDRAAPDREAFGAAFRDELGACGWTVCPPGRTGDAPLLLLVVSTPQAWKGTAGLTPLGRAAVDGALARERVFPIVFGHPRILHEVGIPGLCAWSGEPLMERCAARRLSRLLEGLRGDA